MDTVDFSILHKSSLTNSAYSPKSRVLFLQHNQSLSLICCFWFSMRRTRSNHPFQRWQCCSCKNYPTALLPLSPCTKKIANFSPKLIIKPVISSEEPQALNIRKNVLHNTLSKEGAHHSLGKREENLGPGSVLCWAKPHRTWNKVKT